jgi:quinol monooxygenase YgiN
MLIRHLQYTIKPGKVDEFWKIAKEMESRLASLEGVGTVHRFVDPNNPNTIFSYVEFDEEAGAALEESPAMKWWEANLTPLVANWDVGMDYTVSKAESIRPLTE